MKTFKIIALGLTLFSFLGNVVAQDDFYPSSKNKSDKNEEEINFESENVYEDEYSTATDYYIDNRAKEKEDAYKSRMGITDSTTY